MFAEVADIQIFTCGLGDELRRAETAAVLPDILTQPVKQRREIAPGDGCLQPGQRSFGGMEQLCRIHCPQRVRREIAKTAVGPVDILHTAVAVVIFGG